MALYRGREVQIVTDRPHKFTDRNQVLIQHVEDPSLGTEVVDRAQLAFNEDELNKMLEEEKKDMETRRDSFQNNLKRQEEEEKQSAEFQKEVEQARKDNKPSNFYLKSATYQKGDQVVDDEGVLYRSRINDNRGNAPSKDSDEWAVVVQDRSGTAAIAAPRNVVQQPAPVQQQNQPQAQPAPQPTRAERTATPQQAQPVRNSQTQRAQITPQRGR